MELLVATLAHVTQGREPDALAHIRLVSDTVRNAPGLTSARFYKHSGNTPYYFMLTSWDDEESWQRAQERHNPKQLLSGLAAEIQAIPPEQWIMQYLWGYYRPSAAPMLATAHLVTVSAEQNEHAHQGWIKRLRHQEVQSTLAFAFLARGNQQEAETEKEVSTSQSHENILLNLLSWTSEAEQEAFYTTSNYHSINAFMNGLGVIRTLLLEPM